MGTAKLSVMLLIIYSIVCAILILVVEKSVADYKVVDEFVRQRQQEAMKAILQNYQPLPHQNVNHFNHRVHLATNESLVVPPEPKSNTTRRLLKRRGYRGPCMATNPIDRCWRCRRNWANDRKRLAKCALGFGRKTTGGLAGNIYVVTDPSDNDLQNPIPGTLRHAVIQKEPLWIIFARSMTIKLQQELMINNNKTIDGRGAQIRICGGAGLTIQFVQNVIIHNIRISDIVAGSGALIRDSVDHIGVRTASDGDGISVFGSTNVWIDHLTMTNCKDGLIDVIQESTAVTISNCYMTRHSEVMLFGASDSNEADAVMQITVAFNHFGRGLVQRMPRCRFGFFHVVNNDYKHWEMYAIGGSAHPTIVSQGNRFIAPPDPKAKMVAHRIYSSQDEWKHWSWTSQDDLLVNGAVFIPSGLPPPPALKYRKEMIKPKPGSYVRRLTRFAGLLDCKIGRKC